MQVATDDARWQALVDDLRKERDGYKKAYEIALLELERLRRNLFGRKAERVDPAQVALVFEPFRKFFEPANDSSANATSETESDEDGRKKRRRKHTSHGRRRLADEDLPEETIELRPPAELALGAVQIGQDISYRAEYKRGGWVRLKLVRPRLVMPSDKQTFERTGSPTTVIIAPMPDEMIPGGIAGPGFLAHVMVGKFADHIPFHRQEKILEREGIHVDRGTMCRWAQKCHETASLVVDAMVKDAIATAAVIGTDATGTLVQSPEQCRRGHFWVCIADRAHIFFRYTPRHTHETPLQLFAGFQGYLQADASSVYDALFKKDDGPTEVGCLAHARRKFFEAIRSDKRRALIGVGFINELYDIERPLKDLPPSRRLEVRRARAGPVAVELDKWKNGLLADRDLLPRSPLARALRYLDRHWDALTRFLHDGRVRLDNNPSELELRRLVVGRKNWLFVGSDESAPATATFVSLIASCALHGLDPETYLRDLFRVLPNWPRPRVLELSPKYWIRTRALLDPKQLDMSLGPLTIPPPLRAENRSKEIDAP